MRFVLPPFLLKKATDFLLQDLDALFSIYDQDGSGSISYKEFGQALFGRPNTQA
jgi:Ca2+-binding EF-hand superfamily protein